MSHQYVRGTKMYGTKLNQERLYVTLRSV